MHTTPNPRTRGQLNSHTCTADTPIRGAPIFAPLLFTNIALLAAIGIAGLRTIRRSL